jgi:hypothetical protein
MYIDIRPWIWLRFGVNLKNNVIVNISADQYCILYCNQPFFWYGRTIFFYSRFMGSSFLPRGGGGFYTRFP